MPNLAPWEHPGRIDLLKKLWSGPLSCEQMVHEMRKHYPHVRVTKNAMVAKAHRLHLGPRDREQADLNRRNAALRGSMASTVARRGKLTAEHRTAKESVVRKPTKPPTNFNVITSPRPAGVLPPPKPRVIPMTATACTLLELNAHRCAFTLDAKRDGEWLFCGAPAESRGKGGRFVLCDGHLNSTANVVGPGGVVLKRGSPGMFRLDSHLAHSKLRRSLRRYL